MTAVIQRVPFWAALANNVPGGHQESGESGNSELNDKVCRRSGEF